MLASGSPMPQCGKRNQKGPQVGKSATSPLPSWVTLLIFDYPNVGGGGGIFGGKNCFGPKFVFLRLWRQHPFLHKTKGPTRNPISPTPLPASFGGRPCHHPRRASFTSPCVTSLWADPGASKWGEIRGGPRMGGLAATPLPYGGSPKLQSGGQNQKWPTSGPIGYITPAVWGSPTLHNGGKNKKWPTRRQIGNLTLAPCAVPNA